MWLNLRFSCCFEVRDSYSSEFYGEIKIPKGGLISEGILTLVPLPTIGAIITKGQLISKAKWQAVDFFWCWKWILINVKGGRLKWVLISVEAGINEVVGR